MHTKSGGSRSRLHMYLFNSAGLAVFASVLGVSLFLGRTFAADEGPLSVADLAAYQAALSGRASSAEAPVPVSFEALWKTPEKYQGRRVQVSGRVVRRFRQGAYGVFPPLEEVWVASASGNPLCLVCPAAAKPSAGLGETVRFTGTYLRRVEYQGGDVPRLAPLIVGADPPVVTRAAPPPAERSGGLSTLDWLVGLIAVALVAAAVGRHHLKRPIRRPLDVDVPAPPPEFVREGFEENGRAV